ncbi:MAG: ATP-binding protein [Hespellia sp.]|nr:ATP-binding protein [Hespellia sp.]
MRAKIQKSMELILVFTLLVSYTLMTAIVYHQTLHLLKNEIRQEAEYIQTAVTISGSNYLKELHEINAVDEETRVTWIDANGDVQYDSKSDSSSLENHANRPEIASAYKNGSGSDIRTSGTLGHQMYYYAVRLDDGTVLRLSKTSNSMAATAMNMLPVMTVIAVAMLILAWLLAKWQTARIIKPINDLDIGNPMQNAVYEELLPLLTAIDEQNKEKDAIAQMRKEFSANVSHELKTPLTSISGYAEIMMNGMVKPEDIPTFSERIYKEAKRLVTLVEDIIKLSKLDEESVELEKEDVNLYELTREICTLLSPQAEKKHVHVQISGGNVVYYGIRQILNEMIYNICENAIKYNYENGHLEIWVGNTLNGPKITIADDGIGIPKEHQERIFERFYRVDKSHSKERGGTGLGLSIVKHGAILHDIKVSVESEENGGTKFTLQF